ncbi:hypothetical protein O0L34_g5000 [Tuta absoluta]|nr:hypothetical protein O0L34_g5000 [Tuta absoluta]
MSKDYGANQNTVKKNEVKSQADRKDVDTLEAKDAQEPQNNAPSVQFRCPIMQSPPGRVRTRGGMSQTSSPRKPKWNEDEKEVDVNRLDMEPMDEQNPPNNVPSNQSSIGSIAQSPRGRVRTRGGTSQTSSPRKPKWDGDITNLNVTTLDFLDVIVLADQNEVINIESIDISNSSKHAPDDVSLEFYPVEVFDVTEVEESNSSTQTISQVQSPNSMVQYDSESDTWVCGNNPVEFIVQEDINNVIKLNAADAQEEQNGCPSTSPTAFAASSEHLECANTRTSVLTKILEQIPEKDLKNSPRTPAKTPKGDHSSIRYLKSGRNLPLKKRVRFEDCVENKTIASTKPPERPRRCPQRSHRRPCGVRHLELSKTFQPRTPPKPPVNSFNSELIKCIQNCSSTPKKTHEQNPNDEKPKRSPANTPLKKCGKSPRCVKMNDDGVRSLTSSILKSPEKFSTSSLLKTLSKCLKLAKASGEKPSGFRPRQLLWDRNEDTERKVPNGLNDSERNAVTELELMPKNDGSNSLTEDRASISSTQTISPVQSPNSNESTLGYDGESYTWITSTPTKSPHSEFVKNSTTPRDKTPGQISNSEKSKGIVTSTALNKVVKCPERVQVRDDNQESLPGSALTLPAQSPGDVTNLISEECSTSSSLKEPALRLHRAKAKEKKQRFGFRQGHLLEDKIKYLKNILRDGELDDRLGSNSSELNAVKEIEGMPVADGNNTFMKNHESSASTTSILPEHTSQHEQILGEILGSLSEPTQNAKNMENIHYGSESEDSDSDEEELVPMIVPRAYRVGLNDSFQDDDEKLDLPAAPAMDVGSPAVALAKDLEGDLYSSSLFPRK